jgi:hypothetical protein
MKTRIVFGEESVSDFIDMHSELLFDNAAETGVPGEVLDPDWDRYYSMENNGLLRLFVARERPVDTEDWAAVGDTVVGFCLFLVISHAHYKKRIWAFQDMLWFKKDYRGFAPVRFIKWCDDELRCLGVHIVMRDVTEIVDYGRVLRAFNYEPLETKWVRRL